ncbi:hypothetical protein IT568_03650 [bacterium]|nr:hypothetical protein [bacterium]
MATKTLWDEIKTNLKEGFDFTVSKAEELTKMGTLKLEILGIKRKIEKVFTEIGGISYDYTTKNSKVSLTETESFVKLVAKVNKLKNELEEKETEFAQMNVEVKTKTTKKAQDIVDVDFVENPKSAPKRKAPAKKKTTVRKKVEPEIPKES